MPEQKISQPYRLVVEVNFPVSVVKAQAVLERWWAYKAKRKAYMRERRKLMAGRK